MRVRRAISGATRRARTGVVEAGAQRQAVGMAIDIERILVPLDFSENTPALLEWAAHLADEHSSRLILLHAYHLPVEFQQLEGAYLPPDFWASVRSEAEAQLAEHAEALRARGLAVEIAVCEGYAATVIVEEAARRDADLIVIGTHGLSGLKHLLLGSIAERVVQKAPCPVLTVKK
jgi:nucleotide-binding universal stress UspA family protein